MLTTLRTLFARDLTKLAQEIEAYRNEENLWRTAPGISNSAGNLCLHLVGNLSAFIGAELGRTGYVRHRDLEFSRRDVPRAELLRQVAETRAVVEAALAALPAEQLQAEYPVPVFGATNDHGIFPGAPGHPPGLPPRPDQLPPPPAGCR